MRFQLCFQGGVLVQRNAARTTRRGLRGQVGGRAPACHEALDGAQTHAKGRNHLLARHAALKGYKNTCS